MIGQLFLIAGAALLLVAAIGLLRLTDPFQRMHSATKAGTLGVALMLIGAILIEDVARTSTGLFTILFLLLTLPVGAQLLGRAAYMSGATMDRIECDDPLAGVLDRQQAPLSERLDGTEPEDQR